MEKLSKRAVEEAKKLRKEWGTGNRGAADLFDLAGTHSILVFRLVLDRSLSGAFIRSRKHDTQVVVVNTAGKTVFHQRFTLAHELGHLYLHRDHDGLVESVDEASADPLERQANIFAAELLVPFAELRSLLRSYGASPEAVSDRLVIELAKLFGVSHMVILWRLKNLSGDRMTPEQTRARITGTDWPANWRRYAADADQTGMQELRPEEFQPEGVSAETACQLVRLPRAYKEMAFEAYRKRFITAAKLTEILGLQDTEVVREEILPLIDPAQNAQEMELIRSLQKPADLSGD